MKEIILSFINFIKSLLSTDEKVSSKRTLGVIGMFSLIILMVWNVFNCKEGITTTTLIDAVLYITIAALFGTSLEKFWPNKKVS
mgnify:CR=1 FL=1